MIRSHAFKTVAITPPGAIVDNASFTTATVDTYGYKYATIYVLFGAMDIAMAALKVQESDDSGMSGAADISGATFAGSLPSATADNTIYAFDIALDGTRKRYLDLVATGGDGTSGTYMTSWVVLSGAETTPSTATTRGITGLVQV